MIDLGNRKILDDGTVICEQSAMIEMLYAGSYLSTVLCSDKLDEIEWDVASRLCDSKAPGPIHGSGPSYEGIDWYSHWVTPEPWMSINVREWCIGRCKTEAEESRACFEIDEFEKRGMIPVIRHLIYCADQWRKNGVFWGVGRGSSVSSFVLYLIGINRINPMQYDLDIGEWLK
jgi:hypothetical protein